VQETGRFVSNEEQMKTYYPVYPKYPPAIINRQRYEIPTSISKGNLSNQRNPFAFPYPLLQSKALYHLLALLNNM